MSELKTKIEFANKEDSLHFNSNSKFILTAENVNEIKEVVNNLSDNLDDKVTINDIFHFINFNVPNNLKENCFYTIKIDLSTSTLFEEENTISFETNKDLIPRTTSL